jgi:hypothetical protein
MLTNVAAATQILANALKALDSLREQAKGSSDVTLKANISTLYDTLLDLKAAVLRVEDENTALKHRIEELQRPSKKAEPELRRVGSANFYFDGDKGPCCQPCYDGKGKLTVLTEPEDWSGGVRRQCLLCGEFFYEKPMAHQRSKGSGGRGGPLGWMG